MDKNAPIINYHDFDLYDICQGAEIFIKDVNHESLVNIKENFLAISVHGAYVTCHNMLNTINGLIDHNPNVENAVCSNVLVRFS